MKNLDIWKVTVGDINIKSSQPFYLCYNYDTDKVNLYVVKHNLQVLNIDEFGVAKWTKDISEIVYNKNSPINITYVSLLNQLCVALSNGELVMIDETGTNCDLVGVFENGLLAMEWSPDQDLLVLVTKDLRMIIMSCTYDPISEVELLCEEFGDHQFITVGWGKKETQFHGSAGKQAAKLQTDIGDFDSSDSKVKVTWRGDGNLFAVGFLMEGIRKFKVFDREGNLQFTSEKQPGLESNLTWRPSGNVIATTQKLKEKYVVAFFEKNGLKHGEFDVPGNFTNTIEDLLWSPDSEILLLRCNCSDDKTQKLILFTTSNYHWYQKQILIFPDNEKINQIFWDNDFEVVNNKKLHIVLQNGKHYVYYWIWTVDHSKGRESKDDAVVAVIDRSKLCLTGFRQTIVPPPMSALELQLEFDIHSVHFAPFLKIESSLDTNAFFVNTEHKLLFFEQTQKFPLKYKLIKSLDKDKYNYPFQYYNWYWFNHNTVVAIKVDEFNCYHLVEFDISDIQLSLRHTVPLSCGVMKFYSHPNNHTLLIMQLTSGDIMQYNTKNNDVTLQGTSFKVPCPKFDVVSIKNNLHFLGLSHKGNLYLNDVIVINNVSSYFVHTSFLLITTLQHMLLCIELNELGLEALGKYQKSDSQHIYKRKIERGSKLVIAVPQAINTIFQLPRGNLENIQPRPLSLKIIGDKLDLLDYEEAFNLMRKQRINLNLICDHNRKLFIDNVDKFVDSIKNTSWLCLFLSELENSDVTKTMYSTSYTKNNFNKEGISKIGEICDVLQAQINKRTDRSDKILPLLMTYIKKNTIQDLEEALLIIKELKVAEMNNKLAVGSDEAIKFLLYMVNVDELFNVALGMYDFDLVLLIANKSQKDPKEYLAMLNELNGMDENYKRFTINKHLKRFDKAVKYLANCGILKHEELKTFVKYHSLYREALLFFKSDENIYKEISDDFGLYLKLKKDFVEAGLVYEKSANYFKAVNCYKEALEWELALSAAQHLNKEEHEDLCWCLVQALKDEKRHNEALVILEEYLHNQEETICYATENGQFKTALRLCSKYSKTDLKSKKVLPAVLDEYQNLQNLIETNYNNFVKYKKRLFDVRENKLKCKADNYEVYNTNKDDDLYSDTGSTIASSGSGRSYRSSKNRRKHQRKVASLKEGSQYEDVALIMSLHGLVTSSFNLRLQVKDVNITLNFFNKGVMASSLQDNLEKLLSDMKDSLKQIWTNDLVLQATKAAIDAENVPEGSNIIPDNLSFLEPQVRIAPNIKDLNWKIEVLN